MWASQVSRSATISLQQQFRPIDAISSWPGLSRPSTSFFFMMTKTWMPATSAGMTRSGFNRSPSELHFDQPRPGLGDRFRQGHVEFVRRGHGTPRNPHPLGKRDEVQRRVVYLQHVHGALTGRAGADPVEFAAQNLIDTIGEHDRDDVEALARLRPQRLEGVHRAAVTDHTDHLAV